MNLQELNDKATEMADGANALLSLPGLELHDRDVGIAVGMALLAIEARLDMLVNILGGNLDVRVHQV